MRQNMSQILEKNVAFFAIFQPFENKYVDIFHGDFFRLPYTFRGDFSVQRYTFRGDFCKKYGKIFRLWFLFITEFLPLQKTKPDSALRLRSVSSSE